MLNQQHASIYLFSLKRLHQNRIKIQDELRNVRIEREKLEDELGEAEIKQAGLQELKNAIEVCHVTILCFASLINMRFVC